jgi:very-short-patch-repair endonuclease
MSKRKTKEQFISKAEKIHGNKYDYSKVVYANSYTKVEIVCSQHGSFWQRPTHHIDQKQGCMSCSGKKKLTTEQFVERANLVHGNKWNYSKATYIDNASKVEIVCIQHGSFFQIPTAHISGKQGCPKCGRSKGELAIIKILDSLCQKYKIQHTFETCKDKRELKFDFYLPEHNLCIEFDGIQHYKPLVAKYGNQKAIKLFEDVKRRDSIKTNYCQDNNIKLLRIAYLQYKNIEELIKKEVQD